MNPVANHFDDDPVLQGVIAALQSVAGHDLEVGPTTNLLELERDFADSQFHSEFICNVEERLGILLTHEELSAFYKLPQDASTPFREWERRVAPTLSVVAFADFIRERFVPVSFEPISVLGSPPCPAAGYFEGMRELVRQIRPTAERFGPSTPITTVLRSGTLV